MTEKVNGQGRNRTLLITATFYSGCSLMVREPKSTEVNLIETIFVPNLSQDSPTPGPRAGSPAGRIQSRPQPTTLHSGADPHTQLRFALALVMPEWYGGIVVVAPHMRLCARHRIGFDESR